VLLSLEGRNATPRFHQSYCWCGNRLAADGARAASGEVADDRSSWFNKRRWTWSIYCRFRRAVARARLDRRTILIEYQFGEGSVERYSAIAAEFVTRKVNIIVTSSTPAVLAAKNATSNIPIVFSSAGDPVATGLVESLVHPGGNITGLGFQTIETAGKRIQLLRQVIPDLRQLAILGNSNESASAGEMLAAASAAATISIETKTI
jgi:putative ABC transport system substrate-binding protein